jgi:integrase
VFPLAAACVIAGDCYMIAGGLTERMRMRGKVSKRAVDSIKARATDQFLWDAELKGFGLKVTPAGNKIYILQYRCGGRGTPTKRLTLGSHGELTPEQARTEAKRLAGIIATGGDPASARAAGPTVSGLANRFLTEHVETKTKPRTNAEYRRLIEKAVLPTIGRRRVRDIARADISRLHHELRETPYAANRVLALLSKMFALAEKWGERPDGSNPCRHIEKYRERKRERILSVDEFGRLGDGLAASGRSVFVVAAIKLLIFTGARLSEILGLRWEWIDVERGEARLPDSKTGAKTLHLPPPALAVLGGLPRIDGNPHVIVGNISGAALVNLEKPWRVIRKAAGLEDVRLHDLRHAFAAVAASSGMGLPIIGKMLGHTQAATTHRYAHIASDPVKAAAASVAGKIDAAMDSGRGGKIVPIAGGRNNR